MAQYTPAFMASVQHDVEKTELPLHAIAKKHEISKRTLHLWIEKENWTKRSEKLRELPPAARLLHQATAMLAERKAPGTATETSGANTTDANSPPLSAIDRLERLVEQELTAEEAVRAQLGPLPRNVADAERTARTLSTLTQTLHALQRLRSGTTPDLDDDDDMPRDIDAFRRDLARRIDAFVASRTERSDDDGDPAARALAPVR
jgi:hypothetical protein